MLSERPSMAIGASLDAADLQVFAGEPRLYDVRLGHVLGQLDPRELRQKIKRNLPEFCLHGEVVGTTCATAAQIKRGRLEEWQYYLNEGQALLLCALARTSQSPAVRHQLIRLFADWRGSKVRLDGAAHAPSAVGSVEAFTMQRLEPAKGVSTPFSLIRTAYLEWCEAGGRVPGSMRMLARELKQLGGQRHKSNRTYYLGIRLRALEDCRK